MHSRNNRTSSSAEFRSCYVRRGHPSVHVTPTTKKTYNSLFVIFIWIFFNFYYNALFLICVTSGYRNMLNICELCGDMGDPLIFIAHAAFKIKTLDDKKAKKTRSPPHLRRVVTACLLGFFARPHDGQCALVQTGGLGGRLQGGVYGVAFVRREKKKKKREKVNCWFRSPRCRQKRGNSRPSKHPNLRERNLCEQTMNCFYRLSKVSFHPWPLHSASTQLYCTIVWISKPNAGFYAGF